MPDEIDGACALISALLTEADHRMVDLLLMPEAFLAGHSWDAATIRRRADLVSSDALATLSGRIAAFRATLVVGAFARRGNAVTNSAFVIERGRVVGRYDKAFPNEPGVAAGLSIPVFVRSGVRYGINICADANHPAPAAAAAAGGANLILYPLANLLPQATAERWRDRSIANLIARSRETKCWVASADVVGTGDGIIAFGCTAILDPAGRIVTRIEEGREGMAIHDIPATR